MGKYRVVPRGRVRAAFEDDDDWDDYCPAPHLPEVCTHEEVFTGLVDQHGDPIFRVPRAIGFGATEGW